MSPAKWFGLFLSAVPTTLHAHALLFSFLTRVPLYLQQVFCEKHKLPTRIIAKRHARSRSLTSRSCVTLQKKRRSQGWVARGEIRLSREYFYVRCRATTFCPDRVLRNYQRERSLASRSQMRSRDYRAPLAIDYAGYFATFRASEALSPRGREKQSNRTCSITEQCTHFCSNFITAFNDLGDQTVGKRTIQRELIVLHYLLII